MGYSGRGDGTFAARVKLAGSWLDVDQYAGAGNIPFAGKSAFLARAKNGTLWWYGGLNNGTLGPRDQWGTGNTWGGAHLSLVSALDGGPYPDLLESYAGHLYKGELDLGAGWQIYNLLVGPGDLSGDGKADLLARTPPVSCGCTGATARARASPPGSRWAPAGARTTGSWARATSRATAGRTCWPGTAPATCGCTRAPVPRRLRSPGACGSARAGARTPCWWRRAT
ncbi:hypothetical protein O1L60_15395 [Streptomyces diastatochromogenes]|nr:hypothetical protein [Streptomyces diastatochromogenes]